MSSPRDTSILHHIGNYSEEWRPIFEQVIAEMDYNITIDIGTCGYDFALYRVGNRSTGAFFTRARELIAIARERDNEPSN